MADVAAELAGYKAELARYEQLDRPDRADQVREQIAALEGPARARVAELRRQGDGHQALNQDNLARSVRVQADQLEAELPAQADPSEEAELPAEQDGRSDASDSTPREQAVPTGPQRDAADRAPRQTGRAGQKEK